ncbi:MAG: hypothetical protein Fur0010_09440 [Bdellovibrio sp.]
MSKKSKILTDVGIYSGLVLITIIYGVLFDQYNLALFGYEPHPLLLITVILSAYRGLLFAIIGSLASSVIYLLLLNYQVDYEQVETILSWNYFSLPSSILFISIFVGMIRQTTHDRYKQLLQTQLEDHEKFRKIEALKRKIEIENRELKERLVTRQDSVESLYRVSQKLNDIDKDVLIENFLEVLNEYCHSKRSLIIKREGQSYLPVAQKDFEFKDFDNKWERWLELADKKNNSITLMDFGQDLGEQSLDNHPILVRKLNSNISNEVWYLFVFEIPFLKFVPTTFKMIDMYSKWLIQSIDKISKYHDLEERSFLNAELNIYKNHYYLERLEEEIEQAKHYELKFSVIQFSIQNWDILTKGRQKIAKRIVVENLRSMTKKMDVISEGELVNEIEVMILGSHERAIGIIHQLRNVLAQYHFVIDGNVIKSKVWDYKGQDVTRNNYKEHFVEVM